MLRSTRRRFLAGLSAGAAATFAGAAGRAAVARTEDPEPPTKKTRHELCVFTKPFQSLSYEELAERMAELGFDGVEIPVRDGGHIEPEAAPDELPKLVEALRKHGLEITVMTTSIDRPDKVSEAQLRAAAGLGVERYRTKYYSYDLSKPIGPQIASVRARVRELAALNRELGITACYQNHAGASHVGAAVWDLREILAGVPRAEFGVAFDIRHATVEGGTAWPAHFAAIRDWLNVVYVKDARWVDGNELPENVPLGAPGARVSPRFFDVLAASGFDGPISLHEEYIDHRDPALVPRHIEAIRRDLATLRGWLRS